MNLVRTLLGTGLNVAVYGLLLFVPAQTLSWSRAWVLLALIFLAMIATRVWVFRHDDGLIAERRKPPFQQGQPLSDKIVVVGFLLAFPAYIAFIPIDVFHLHLLEPPGIAVAVAGLLLAVIGMSLISFAFRANAFALPIVKDQSERNQIVIDRGVYGVVRHPLYAGVVLVLIGTALWLGSSAAALASIVPIGLLVARVLVEEHFLRARLPAYAGYAARVKYRLIPGIW